MANLLDTTMRLCGNSQGSIFRLGEDGLYRQAVGSGMQREYYEIEARQEIRPGPATLLGGAAAARPIQIVGCVKPGCRRIECPSPADPDRAKVCPAADRWYRLRGWYLQKIRMHARSATAQRYWF